MADSAFPLHDDTPTLPNGFRKLDVRGKRTTLERLVRLSNAELHASGPSAELIDLAEVMVESAAGIMPVPLGIATGFRVDERVYHVPMATEEPSVIAAATYTGNLVAHVGGGFRTGSTGSIVTAQIAIDAVNPGALEAVQRHERDLHAALHEVLSPMSSRGGGWRGMDVRMLPESGLLVVYIHVDTCDAMGANIVNTAAETLRKPLERITGGTVLMCILSNASLKRRAWAEFEIPTGALSRDRFDGATMAQRVVRGNQFACEDPLRAVTHNKGIMNGITACALATGNDTRAIEAAAHAWAARSGSYRALTEYRVEDDALIGRLEIPLAVGTVGGAIGFHPVTTFALKVLFLQSREEPSADRLARVMVSLGLAQNLAAVLALTGEGIQHGHMRRHARRLAWKAGARGTEIQRIAERVWQGGVFNTEAAARLLETLRSGYVE